MTNAEEYLAAQFPDTYYVLGHRMAKFTLGHAMLLERLKSPFVVPEPKAMPGWGDLRLAIAACGRKYPRAERLMRSRLLKWRLALVICPPQQLVQGVVQMARYITASRVMPECWSCDGDEGRQAGAPFLQLLKITQMMHLHKTELKALCTPFAVARWDYAAVWEIRGRLKIVSEEDRQTEQRAKELYERGQATRNGAAPLTPDRHA